MRRIVLQQTLCGLLLCLLSPTNLRCQAAPLLSPTSLRKAEIQLRRAIGRHPDDPELHFKLARVLAAQKSWRGAIPQYGAVLRVEADNVAAYEGLGEAYEQLGDLDPSIANYTKVIVVDPQNFDGHLSLCRLLPRKHFLAESLSECAQAIRIKPDSGAAHTWLGWAHYMRQELKEAVDECELALKLEPRSPWAHVGIGQVLHTQGRFAEAIEEYSQALAMDPDLPEVLADMSLAYVNRAQEEKESKQEVDLREGVRRAQEALRLRSYLPLAHFTLGLAAFLRKSYDQALADFRTALDERPDYTEARINIGVILLERLDLEGAVAEFREATRLEPESALAHYYLGLGLQKTGDLDGAIEEFQESLHLDSNLHGVRDDLGKTIKQRELLRGLPPERVE